MAGDDTTGFDLPQCGDLGRAALILFYVGASRMERAAGRGVARIRDFAGESDAIAFYRWVRHRHGGEESDGVRV